MTAFVGSDPHTRDPDTERGVAVVLGCAQHTPERVRVFSQLTPSMLWKQSGLKRVSLKTKSCICNMLQLL